MPDKPTLKSLFETPQKARITILCSLVALLTLGALFVYAIYCLSGAGAADPSPSQTAAQSEPSAHSEPLEDTPAPTQAPVGLVPNLTIDQAREIALTDAGLEENQIDLTRESLTQDNGVWVYEFRFHTDADQYEYLLNANTGELRRKVKESLVYPSPGAAEPPVSTLPAGSAPPVETAPQLSQPPQPDQSAAPDASQPPASAAPVETTAPSPAPSQSGSMYIGMDRAKSIALRHAGLDQSQVRFTHLQMGREDGRMVYEIEFRQGRVAYEYEIDASSGQILDHERDAD